MTNYFVRYLLLLLPTILISCKDGFDKELEREAKEFTTNRCPIEVESGTTLDSLIYDPNRKIYTSYYSLNGTNEPFYSSNAPLLHQRQRSPLALSIYLKQTDTLYIILKSDQPNTK